MKHRNVILLLCLAGAKESCVAADAEVDRVQLRCLAAADDCFPGADPKLALWVFGGGPLDFRADVEAPLGSCVGLRADLVQVSTGGVALPLLQDVTVAAGLDFAKRTHQTTECSLARIPSVTAPTQMLLTVRAETTGQPQTAASTHVDVFAYPAQKGPEWRQTLTARLAQSGLERLAVFGSGQTLRTFLRERRVDFDDLGKDWPAAATRAALYLGDTPPPMPARITSVEGLRFALFLPSEGSALLPGVYHTNDAHGGCLLKVTLPGVLAHLSSNVRGQQTLAEIFRLALAPRVAGIASTPAP
jgi:hypothetical protein